MYKIYTNKPGMSKGYIPKIMLIMRLTTVILITTFMQVYAVGFAQKISMSQSNAPLKTVLKVLKYQSGYNFVYTDDLLKMAKPININVDRAELEDVLTQIFREQPLTYSVNKNTITLKEKLFLSLNDISENALNDVVVRGKITDSKGETLPGVSVRVKGTTIGTSTDIDGRYSLNVSDNAILVISYIGYLSQEVAVSGRNSIDIILEVSTASLNEVVVTALGIKQQSRALSYATQNVKAKEMTEVRDPNNFLNSFQGKVANALITQSSGGVGTSSSIILRGNRSIQGSNNALIVIDGVPSLGGSTSNINPDDIESISVLRGASAGALYGSEAGNGVLVITTKMGSKDNVTVNVNSGMVVHSAIGLPRLQNTYGQGSSGIINATSGTSWGPKMEGQTYTNYKGRQDTYSPEPDNIKDFFNSGISLNNSISVAGGTDKIKNYLSYTNTSNKGIVPTNNLTSHNVNLRLSTQVSKRFSADSRVTYFKQNIENRMNGTSNNPVIRAYQIGRNIKLSDVKDYQIINNGVPASAFWPSTDNLSYQNPYWTINGNQVEENTDRVSGYLKAKYQITDWLNITGNASLEKSFSRDDHFVMQGVYFNPAREGGSFEVFNNVSNQKWFDAMFDGTNKISKDLSINYQAGAIYRDNSYNQDASIANGLNVPNKFSVNFASNSILRSNATQIQTQSVFGQFNLSYKDALFLNGSLRNDWSSLLPKPHSFQYFSLGTSAVLSDLFDLPQSISYLKANVNFAEVGNGGKFGLLASTYNYTPGTGNGYLMRNDVLPFPGLKPEIVRNLEFGVDLRLLNDRLRLSATYYQSNSFNQLLSLSVPAATGFASKYINAGNIRNRGVELVLGATPIKGSGLNWDIDFNLGMNRNKIIELADDLKVIYLGGTYSSLNAIQVREGGAYGDVTSAYWAKDNNGNNLVTANGLPIYSNQRGELGKVIGNFNPSAILGLTNTFNYKKFSLRVLTDGRIGGIVLSQIDQDRVFDGASDFTVKYREGGWNLGGVDVNGSPVSATITAQNFWQSVSSKRQGIGEFFAYDATNIRLREVALGYSVPLSANLFIKSARLALVGRNLLWLYRGSSILDIPGLEKRKMWFDPDFDSGGIQSNFGHIPSTRTIGLNLSLNF